MPIYEIEQFEMHTQKYRVEADSEAQAIKRLFAGEADVVDGSLEFIQVADDCGLPVDEYRDLADALDALGESVDDDVIPSIRCIVQVDNQRREQHSAATASATGRNLARRSSVATRFHFHILRRTYA